MRCARHRAGSAVSRPGSRGGAMKLRGRQGERGQATVELAVVLPVALVVAVIAVNALAFFGTCASFDRVARQTVCALATAPASGDDTASLALAVEQALTRQVGEQGEVQVRAEGLASGLTRFTARIEYAPTLFGLGMRSEIFGVALPPLAHEVDLVVDAYKPGIMF